MLALGTAAGQANRSVIDGIGCHASKMYGMKETSVAISTLSRPPSILRTGSSQPPCPRYSIRISNRAAMLARTVVLQPMARQRCAQGPADAKGAAGAPMLATQPVRHKLFGQPESNPKSDSARNVSACSARFWVASGLHRTHTA